MEIDHIFLLAIQSSFILGLIHGVNPCGHSWLVIAPFVSGTKNGGRVAFLTISFLAGTSLACLVLGGTLGAISSIIPTGLIDGIEDITSAILILLGLIMILKPHLLHHHDHEDDRNPCSCSEKKHGALKHHKTTGGALFGLGFINMIIPCPTVALMYSFAIESGSYARATIVFGAYALSTCLAVGGMIYGIFKVTNILRTMEQQWVETAIMRTIGAMTLFFGLYSFLIS